jgi:hypothetical protein
MSQHYFNTEHQGEPITVVLGWDRPLGHYFMLVERREPAPEQDDYLYINLDHADAFELELDDYRAKLEELGIKVPEVMFDEVERDCIQRVGNRQVVYDQDGRFQGATANA